MPTLCQNTAQVILFQIFQGFQLISVGKIVFSENFRELGQLNLRSIAQGDSTRDDVLQFANIAWKIVLFQHLYRLF